MEMRFRTNIKSFATRFNHWRPWSYAVVILTLVLVKFVVFKVVGYRVIFGDISAITPRPESRDNPDNFLDIAGLESRVKPDNFRREDSNPSTVASRDKPDNFREDPDPSPVASRDKPDNFREDSDPSPVASRDNKTRPEHWFQSKSKDIPHIAVTICGNRLEEPLVMLKSLVLFTDAFLVIHVFADSKLLHHKVETEFESWPNNFRNKFEYYMYDVSFPEDVSCKGCEWKNIFAPCATQRLFLADVLLDVDSILYVDADTLFFTGVENLWRVLGKFNSTQFLGAASVTEVPHSGIYIDQGRFPYYGSSGINSGVLLMNLTRIRAAAWLPELAQGLMKYKKYVRKIGDQDLINIYLHNHPERGYLIGCEWNFRMQQCDVCHEAERNGVALIHGFIKTFTTDKCVPFKAMYLAFKQHRLGINSVKKDLVPAIKRKLSTVKAKDSLKPNKCHTKLDRFTKRMGESGQPIKTK